MNRITLFFTFCLIISCAKEYQKVDLEIQRFDRDLFEINKKNQRDKVSALKNKYGSFYDFFESQIINRGNLSDQKYYQELIAFTNHNDMREAYDTVQIIFSDLSKIENELGIAFWNFSQFFPDHKIPKITAFFSGFNYGVITFDNYLAIGLENFLGANSKYYSFIGKSKYLRLQNQERFICANVLEAWLNECFQLSHPEKDLLSQLIYKGKVMYCIDKMLPQISLADKFRFNQNQMNWTKENEEAVWQYFIHNDLLFSKDEKRYRSYINYAPFAKGMPKESPGRIGYYIGYKIVSSYMNNSEIDYNQLMLFKDSREFLKKSQYKPKK